MISWLNPLFLQSLIWKKRKGVIKLFVNPIVLTKTWLENMIEDKIEWTENNKPCSIQKLHVSVWHNTEYILLVCVWALRYVIGMGVGVIVLQLLWVRVGPKVLSFLCFLSVNINMVSCWIYIDFQSRVDLCNPGGSLSDRIFVYYLISFIYTGLVCRERSNIVKEINTSWLVAGWPDRRAWLLSHFLSLLAKPQPSLCALRTCQLLKSHQLTRLLPVDFSAYHLTLGRQKLVLRKNPLSLPSSFLRHASEHHFAVNHNTTIPLTRLSTHRRRLWSFSSFFRRHAQRTRRSLGPDMTDRSRHRIVLLFLVAVFSHFARDRLCY